MTDKEKIKELEAELVALRSTLERAIRLLEASGPHAREMAEIFGYDDDR